MYLKSLEVQGFKSFPDKTLIRFGDDITAIVGPNGSGKSNISDAILWVMGEQSSKTLRGAKMEDVIFGGTQKRSSVGFAEATLTLDNTDRALAYDADEVLSSTSELLPPKTPPKHTGVSFVAIRTESVVKSLSTSSRVTIFSPASALLTQRYPFNLS